MWNQWIRFYQIAKRFVFIIKDAWKVFTFFFKCGNGQKFKEKVSTTVLTAIFIENSYGYKYSLRICLKLFSNPI